MLRDLQDAFRRGVLEDDGGDALALIRADAIPAERRLAIYRNNTIGSLVKTLMASYPVVCRLVGERFFRNAACAFIRAEPPRQPQLLAYGAGFADFLAALEPARPLPYLADVARLEWARQEALFAAEAEPLAPTALQSMPVQHYPALVFALHPAVRLVGSAYPVHRIWAAHQDDGGGARIDWRAGGEHALVTRPALKVHCQAVTAGDAALLQAMQRGAPLEFAAAAAAEAEPGFDLQQALINHLVRGTFRDVSIGSSKLETQQ